MTAGLTVGGAVGIGVGLGVTVTSGVGFGVGTGVVATGDGVVRLLRRLLSRLELFRGLWFVEFELSYPLNSENTPAIATIPVQPINAPMKRIPFEVNWVLVAIWLGLYIKNLVCYMGF